MPDQPSVIVEVRTTRVAQQRGRSRRNTPAHQVGINDRGRDSLRQCPADRFGASLVGFLWRLRCTGQIVRSVRANDAVYFGAGFGITPVVPLADEDDPISRAAPVAVIGAFAVFVVVPKAI